MLHPAWIEREAPLARCPLNGCKRSGICRHQHGPTPCRRTHETRNEAYIKLARKLEGLAAQFRREDPEGRHFAAEGTPEFEYRLKLVYDGLRAADAAQSARRAPAGRKR